MPRRISRRDAVARLAAASAGLALPRVTLNAAPIIVAGRRVAIGVESVSHLTVRITVSPVEQAAPLPVPVTGALAQTSFTRALAGATDDWAVGYVRAGDLSVRFTPTPPTLHVETIEGGKLIQRLTLDAQQPGMSFPIGSGPLLGMGEGGPQYDRRGNVDTMRAGQAGYHLATHGTRAPVQWLIGSGNGWAMFIHQPYGTFDLTGTDAKFTPTGDALPLDVFVVGSNDPAVVMREYARITGLAEMPPRWGLGYLQSHRTLAGPDEVMGVAHTMREKKLPCDALIYLGTEFTPSGWNTRNGEFTWKKENFPDPKGMIQQLHDEHYRVVLHIVIEGKTLTGSVKDACTAPPLPSGRTSDDRWPPDRQASCYWPAHKPLMDLGVDGWWPDQGDGLDGPSRLNRHRMYYEGTLLYRPNERPFALHRNASPGIQRYGGFIWSGDVQSRWETLKTHVPVAINTSLSGMPYWGTDIGGFIPTAEYTGELHVRWFQFGAFNPLFRAHGRHWHLRLPWGWDGGDGGPPETNSYHPDPAELHNAKVEPILKKYLELRYQLMPYLYSAVRECCETGMPVMRALWIHAPNDPVAVACGDEFLWGPDMLVAPVVEQGATTRRVYLPPGMWYDFWTNERVEGGKYVDRAVDLETTPLYVRAGAVIPMGPVKQYSAEPNDAPLELIVYPGADGASSVYDDDGIGFGYKGGEWTRTTIAWEDAARRLTLRADDGVRAPKAARKVTVRLNGSAVIHLVEIVPGRPVTISL